MRRSNIVSRLEPRDDQRKPRGSRNPGARCFAAGDCVATSAGVAGFWSRCTFIVNAASGGVHEDEDMERHQRSYST
jgi:hypothetical protein